LANNVGRTEELLEACPRELRQWEWRYLKRLGQSGLTTFRGHDGEVRAVAFDVKGKRVASASWDGTIKIWDVGTIKALTLRGHKGRVEDVTFSPDGERLASAGWDKTVKVWEVATGKIWYNLAGHRDQVTAVAFSPDGRRLASASHDKTVKVWEARPQAGCCTRSRNIPTGFSALLLVSTVAASPPAVRTCASGMLPAGSCSVLAPPTRSSA
jgi:WD40 repeat protein